MRKPQGKIKNLKQSKRVRRKLSIRKKVNGTQERPRVCMTKTNKHIVVQVVNDETRKTLFSVQTYGKNAVKAAANKEGAKLVGAKVAERLKTEKMTNVVFDRNGLLYTGVVAELANSLRENGIQV